ncbi:hypothetical protein DL764_005773 [Monosporascus ibericus]|uniref:XPG-I domain-containing protein n=1 Tax=Monosporascus ibericus TaxID=155417 RepID=A0A4V1XAF1_9PEZI|nr:hypothetical protein DL764_005773 [Monosporascus ibericus]
MGITGAWEQVRKVTPGEEATLAQLAAECVRGKGRPLRIAIDTPFAVFQYNEATRPVASYDNVNGVQVIGGMNHPTWTLYYHIQHLLRAGVQPLFIYDGQGKLPVKRHRYHRHFDNYVPYEPPAASSRRTPADIEREYDPQHVTYLSKQILDLLGIPWYVAPGEAEAECARLEEAGTIDAVLTKDGDAFVFGSNTILQRLDAENEVAMVRRFRMRDLRAARPPLRQQDLFLLALMAGGDYHDGIPGCGPVVAIEAARAGYSGELQALLRTRGPTKTWRDKLASELRTNEKGRFSRRWAAVANAIRKTFPLPTVANYYFEPAVSSREKAEEYGRYVNWHKETDARGLREWTAKYLDWKHAYHACKFVNNLAPALLARKLMVHSETGVDGSYFIKAIHAMKPMNKQAEEAGDDNNDENSDDTASQLRVSYYPATVINIDVSEEQIVPGYKANIEKLFDPQKDDREWFPRWMLEKGAPTAFRQWQDKSGKKSDKKSSKKRAATMISEDAPRKRPRGRPRKDRLENAQASATPQGNRTQGGVAASNAPSPALNRISRVNRDQSGFGASDQSCRVLDFHPWPGHVLERRG